MSDDMLDQLAAYGHFHRLHQKSVTVVEVAEHSSGRPPVTDRLGRNDPGAPEARFDPPRNGEATGPVGSVVVRRRGESVTSDGLARASERSSTRRRGLVIAVAAAAVAAVVFAGVTLLDSGGEDVGTVAAGRGASAPGTVLPLAQIQLSDLGLDLPERLGAGIGAVAVGGPGLVAVGSDGDDAAVWTSADGQIWSRVPDDEAVFGGAGFQGMRDVVVGGPGFVAVGRDSSIVGPDTYAVAAVWTSPDGISWSRVTHDDAVFGRAPGEANDIFRMTAVTTGGPGLVAIGERGGESDRVVVSGGWIADRAVGAVWTSIDGITWSRVPHDPAVFGQWPTTSAQSEPAGWGLSASMRDITPGGPGLVVVGDIYAVGGAPAPAPCGRRPTASVGPSPPTRSRP